MSKAWSAPNNGISTLRVMTPFLPSSMMAASANMNGGAIIGMVAMKRKLRRSGSVTMVRTYAEMYPNTVPMTATVAPSLMLFHNGTRTVRLVTRSRNTVNVHASPRLKLVARTMPRGSATNTASRTKIATTSRRTPGSVWRGAGLTSAAGDLSPFRENALLIRSGLDGIVGNGLYVRTLYRSRCNLRIRIQRYAVEFCEQVLRALTQQP